jgi:hypothetical protein
VRNRHREPDQKLAADPVNKALATDAPAFDGRFASFPLGGRSIGNRETLGLTLFGNAMLPPPPPYTVIRSNGDVDHTYRTLAAAINRAGKFPRARIQDDEYRLWEADELRREFLIG